MRKTCVRLVVALLSVSLISPTAMAAPVNSDPSKNPFTQKYKKTSYQSQRITKEGDPSCFLDVLTFGGVTTLKFGSGLTQVVRRELNGRVDSVTTNGVEQKLQYDGPGQKARITAVRSADGTVTTIESIKARVEKKRGAPKMTSTEMAGYLKGALEKNWCPTVPKMSNVTFLKVDSENIPEEYFDEEYWIETMDTILVTAMAYDPICIEADCISWITDWRDTNYVLCGVGAAVFWFAPIAAAAVLVACTAGTLQVFATHTGDCSNPPPAWSCE